jgi:hypothetical protein
MSTERSTAFERTQRGLARRHGTLVRAYIELAAPWNRAGDSAIDGAYVNARRAARHALRSIDARERRMRPRLVARRSRT